MGHSCTIFSALVFSLTEILSQGQVQIFLFYEMVNLKQLCQSFRGFQLIWALLVELWQNDQFFSCSDREHAYISIYAPGSKIRKQKRT